MTPSGVYPNICISILTCPAVLPMQFYPNVYQNGKPTWVSSGYVMYWNVSLLQWEVQNYTIFGGKLVSKTTQTPPLSGWFVQGGTSNPTVSVTTGTCPSYAPFSITTQKTDSDCSNNGSISFTTCGGQAPYQYSINGGNSFSTSSIFNNLSPQTYNLISKDSLGNTATSTVTITANTVGTTTYILSITNYNVQTINDGYQTAYWIADVVPPIPQGTTISFTLNIDSTQINNGPGSGTTSSLSTVFNNGTLLTPTDILTNTQTTTRQGCSPDTTEITLVNENYNVTMGYGTVISGMTISSLNITSGMTSTNGCVTNVDQSISVYATGGIASGCNCCTVNTDSLSYGGISNHSLSYGQGQSQQLYFSVEVGLGTSPLQACSDISVNRLMNGPTFTTGVRIFTGSPSNPQVASGYSYAAYGLQLYTISPQGFIEFPTGDSC